MESILGIISFLVTFNLTIGISYLILPLRKILIIAFLLRASSAFINYYIVLLPDGRADAITFEQTAWQWSQNGFWKTFQHFDLTGSYVYSFLLSIPYSLLGRSPLMAQSINVALGILIVWSGYKLALLLWGQKSAVCAAWLIAVFPTLVMYSSVTLREVWIVLPFMIGLICVVKWYQTNKHQYIIGGFISFITSAIFHGAMIFAFLIFLLLVSSKLFKQLITKISRDRIPVTKTCILILIFSGAAFVLANNELFTLSKVEQITNSQTEIIEVLQHVSLDRSRGTAAYLVGIKLENLYDLIWYVPLKVIYFLFSPFLWNLKSVSHLIGLVDSLFYVLIFFSLLKKYKNPILRQKYSAVIIIIISMIVIFSLGTGNFGTAIRHRAKFAPALLSVCSLCKTKRAKYFCSIQKH